MDPDYEPLVGLLQLTGVTQVLVSARTCTGQITARYIDEACADVFDNNEYFYNPHRRHSTLIFVSTEHGVSLHPFGRTGEGHAHQMTQSGLCCAIAKTPSQAGLAGLACVISVF